ncbi:MAG: hypothetical protein ACYCVD_16815 [Desulfitobacteriaceae bacterium]
MMLINLLGSIVDPKVLATLGTVLSLVLADFVFGVLVSLRNGNFSLSKLPQFVETSLIPYIGGLLVLALFSNANTELRALFFTIAATITVKFLADITTKVTQLFSGIQIQIQSPINVTPVVQPQPTSAPVTNAPVDPTPIPTEVKPVDN